MNRFQNILKKIFCPPLWLTALIAVPSFTLVFYMLVSGADHSPLTYFSYGASAYALVICVTGIVRTARRSKELPLMKKIRATAFGSRYLEDYLFRSKVSLHRGLVINMLYIAIKLFSGFWYRSVWFVALAVYYLLLSVMRFFLAQYVRKVPIGQDIPSELRRYRMCGYMLLLMNQALIGIVVLIVYQNKGYSYPGYLIYAMAAYTFYAFLTAIMNVVKSRKQGSPVLSAVKAINLTAAIVSMLSLETAMLAKFGGDDPAFRRVMTSATGGGVCLSILIMAIYMILRASRALNTITRKSTAGKIDEERNSPA